MYSVKMSCFFNSFFLNCNKNKIYFVENWCLVNLPCFSLFFVSFSLRKVMKISKNGLSNVLTTTQFGPETTHSVNDPSKPTTRNRIYSHKKRSMNENTHIIVKPIYPSLRLKSNTITV